MRTIPVLALAILSAACARPAAVGSPSPDASTSYVVRLGADTVAIERFSRAGNRIESAIVQRSPSTFVGNSNIEVAANGLASTWRYEARLANGARPVNGATATFTFGGDSTTYTITRDTGVATSRRITGGAAIPSLSNSMLTQNLAVAYARMQGRDSVDVPTVSTNGTRGALPIRFVTPDSVRIWYFGSPMYAKLDAAGQIRWLDGIQTTNKIMGVRVARLDLPTMATAYAARDAAAGPMGAPTPRDTARAQIMGNSMWIDYGRPSLRGRNVWVNGVLGDTLWRTGGNAATQFHTSSDIRIGGQIVAAGTYTLWTRVAPGNARYELVFNRQVGQWGTDHDATRDFVRVPLTERNGRPSMERFTMTIEPAAGGGVIAMQWGTKRLEAPFTVAR